jgi:hypothetical protein
VSLRKIVAIKSANHFRAGFKAVTADIISVNGEGLSTAAIESFHKQTGPLRSCLFITDGRDYARSIVAAVEAVMMMMMMMIVIVTVSGRHNDDAGRISIIIIISAIKAVVMVMMVVVMIVELNRLDIFVR